MSSGNMRIDAYNVDIKPREDFSQDNMGKYLLVKKCLNCGGIAEYGDTCPDCNALLCDKIDQVVRRMEP